jgi:hypothetical protein
MNHSSHEHTTTNWNVVFLILGLIAVVFGLAIFLPSGVIKTTSIVAVSAVWAFFLLNDLMHLKYETKTLKLSLSLPIIFLFWLVGVLFLSAIFYAVH